MFENIRQCLDEFEGWLNHREEYDGIIIKSFNDKAKFFELDLAKALIRDCNAEKVAKIILATSGLSNDIKVKVE